MNPLPAAKHLARAMVLIFGFCLAASNVRAAVVTTARQKSLEEWRNLTALTAEPPRVFVKGHRVRFYFQWETNLVGFDAKWSHHRIPPDGFAAASALLRWDKGLSRLPEAKQGWREATVIAGAAWRRYATNLIEGLTPQTPWHGVYYQAFLADRVLYRDAHGTPHLAPQGEQPAQVIVDHRFPLEETLQVLAGQAEKFRAEKHPDEKLFVFMSPNGDRMSQPLLVDRENRQCVNLLPAALLESPDRGLSFAATLKGLGALVESHTLPLLKNPVSSAARLADLGVETAVVVLHLRLPRSASFPPLAQTNGMDLVAWEKWLDRYTGTRREDGSVQLLIDGDRFFTRLQQAIGEATNRISMNVFIFDRDDVAVGIADQLKRRSAELPVKVILDQMASITAGMAPPTSPMPVDFVPPGSITGYLRQDSRVRVRPFLNPWFSADHTKVLLVDGNRAWVGGMNLGREYRYEWHDLMFELQGPVVASLENEFKRDWAHAGLLGDLAFAGAALKQTEGAKPAEPDRWIKVRRLPTRTAWKPFNVAVQTSIRKARSYIYVENPYIFDKRVITGLVQARKRGVDVRVVLPRVNDFKAGARGNVVTANYLLEHGVRVYFYPGMTHVKAMLVDGWSCLGTGNLNHMSLRLCQEQNIATSDPEFAARLKKELFEEDFTRSFELQQPISVDWVDFLADLLLEGF
ncbi:MAG: phosphatidylserine/phosphatidylglycerophosphate/cardiolipin synthase family protein [Verrucomicrobia bacterium]|jgi:phosphatidylserine/phosphatidylglycerophosphate/cardiolipin synthase-like enzyme|nr:phosphatidylserine/phosphatidylglycerophosphate/cardiolipin synthase family protein [Verrucomicrobiota bacterium]